jgi:hypothetical protein
MDETRSGRDEAELQQPDEAIKDLEPEEHEGEAVTGGAIDSYLQFGDAIKYEP